MKGEYNMKTANLNNHNKVLGMYTECICEIRFCEKSLSSFTKCHSILG